MLQKFCLGCCLILIAFSAKAQTGDVTSDQYFEAGIEFQAYPTGLIPGVRLENGFAGKHAIHFRLGYQWIRHRDLGVHDDERGTGVGFTLGYRKFFKEGFRGLSLSSRCDFWANKLDWKDEADPEITGTSKIKVIQPTIELGYTFLGSNQIVITPTVAFGYEVNVKTEGADVGEGAILLIGLEVGWRF